MTDIIVIAILLIIVGSASAYIIRTKKKGAKCIGCPMSGNCCNSKNGKDSCSCDCGKY